MLRYSRDIPDLRNSESRGMKGESAGESILQASGTSLPVPLPETRVKTKKFSTLYLVPYLAVRKTVNQLCNDVFCTLTKLTKCCWRWQSRRAAMAQCLVRKIQRKLPLLVPAKWFVSHEDPRALKTFSMKSLLQSVTKRDTRDSFQRASYSRKPHSHGFFKRKISHSRSHILVCYHNHNYS